MSDLIDDLARAVAFLSRLPVPGRHLDKHDGSLSRAVRAFPAAGLLIALPPALLAGALDGFAAPPFLAAALVVVLQVLVTGALHEDGLADTADGLGAGHDRERALAIMKDSRTGVYGVCALLLVLALRILATGILLRALPPLSIFLALLAAAAASRAAMLGHWSVLEPARPGGLAASAGTLESTAVWSGVASGFGAALALLWLACGLLPAVVGLGLAALAAWAFTLRTEGRLGGFTGDTIGAAQQIAETALLVGIALAL